MDPFRVPDLDDLYEQEKLKKGLSKQLIDAKTQKMHDLLEERLEAIKDKNALKGLNPNDLNLVSDLVIPPHFKMPRCEKYDGISCPKMHLIMYCNKMTIHAHNEKLLVTPRPGKGRHVATAACPRVEPGYPGSNQEPARLKLIFQG